MVPDLLDRTAPIPVSHQYKTYVRGFRGFSVHLAIADEIRRLAVHAESLQQLSEHARVRFAKRIRIPADHGFEMLEQIEAPQNIERDALRFVRADGHGDAARGKP